MKRIEKKLEIGGKILTLTTGELAEQAASAVTARIGDTVVLATVAVSDLKQELDYFPLTIDYQERLYAGGRIKGSRWVKREGRPTDEEILSGRLIDRSIRPLFPKTYKKEVQIIITVLSVDMENDPAIVGALAASAAVHTTTLPWKGPVSTFRVGFVDEKYILNPVNSEIETSKMDLVVSSTKEAVLMVEAGANEATEEEILKGISFAFDESKSVLKLIEEFANEVGVVRDVYKVEKASPEIEKQVKELVKDRIPSLVKNMALHEGHSSEYSEFVAGIQDKFETEDEKKQVVDVIEHLKKDHIREQILKKGIRPDGRKLTEIRKLSAQVGYLPRVHGSGLFKRGQTQVLSVLTLAATSQSLLLESAEGEDEKRYIHHYSMPPYATGETGRVGSPGRREIGHGALAERSLVPVIPDEKDFPYTIRVVSEVMSSNGSTSMASVCGSTLALMDAGVPILAPVSGIAMGLIIESDDSYAILSDIMGIEDFNGDMDFKVAGTSKGITALQLDVKTLNLTPKILEEALEQAKKGRAEILKVMTDTISESRKEVNAFAPKIKVVMIPVDKIGELIGPSGKNIKKLAADTGAQIDVEDDGSVSISAVDPASMEKAVAYVEGMIKEVQVGEIYEGEVVRLLNFGAFVNILPGKDGMVHVSDMGKDGYVNDASDVLSIGQKVTVRVKKIDEMKRISLSLNLDPAMDEKVESLKRDRNGGGGGYSRGPRRDFNGRSGGGRGFSRDRGGDKRNFSRPSGPHFPTSRYFQTDTSPDR
jgi:polyribonucleotide nucleotidyltransferase